MDTGLSVDPILTQIRDLFYESAYARRTNPDKEIINKFTEQQEITEVPKKPAVKRKNHRLLPLMMSRSNY